MSSDLALACPSTNNRELTDPASNTTSPLKESSPASERLIISKVVVENFKSYGGKHVIGPFHKRFTSIIGPNGSGKSNVVDAMLFVFGRRAQQLRHRKLSDLIHQSASLKKLDFARVSIHFENVVDVVTAGGVTEFRSVPKTEFVVSREARADNTSQYALNGMPTTQKEVTKLLKAKGVDLDHNRFLILQGEVEQIAMMKPKGATPNEEGLLEYLEDLIGSNRFIEPIEAKRVALTTLSEATLEKRSRAQAAKGEVDDLKGPRKLAEQFCEAQRRVLLLKGKLEMKTKLDLEKQQKIILDKLNEVKGEATAWRKGRDEAKKEIDTLTAAVRKQKDVVTKAERYLKGVETEFGALEKVDSELSVRQAHSVKRYQALQKEVVKLTAEKQRCEKEVEDLREKASEATKNIPSLTLKYDKLSNDLEELERSLESEFGVLRAEKEKLEKTSQPLTRQLETAKGEMDLMGTRAQLFEEKLHKAKALIDAQQQNVEASKSRLQASKTHLDDAKKNAEKTRKALVKTQQAVTSLRDTYNQKRQQLGQLKESLDADERKVREVPSSGVVADRILEARDDGRLQGVVDRLWNLGSVPKELETAFTAATGVDYIVVEETKDAQAVVEFVRQRNLGRVVCIVLSRVKKELEKDLMALVDKRLPAKAKLLIDLVDNCAAKHRIAFFFALRDTLLVSTLEEAQRAAFGGATRWRVVTTDGQIIDKAGTMTGGMLKQEAGDRSLFRRGKSEALKATSAADIRNIERAKTQVRDLSAEVEALLEQKSKKERELEEIDASLGECDRTIARYAAEVEVAEKDVAHYKAECSLLTSASSAKVPELSAEERESFAELKQEMTAKASQVRMLEERCKRASFAVDEISQKIQGVGGEKRRVLREALESAKSELDQASEAAATEGFQAEVNKKRAEKLGLLIPEKLAEAEAEKAVAKKIADEKESLTDKAEEVMKRKEDVEKVLEEQRQVEKERTQALREVSDKLKHAGLREVEFETALQELDRDASAIKHSLKKVDKVLGRLDEDYQSTPSIAPENSDELLESAVGGAAAVEGGAIVPYKEMKKDVDAEEDLKANKENDPMGSSLPSSLLTALAQLSTEELEALDEIYVACEIKKLMSSLESSKVDISIVEKYNAALNKYRQKNAEFVEASRERDDTKKELELLEAQRLSEFCNGFLQIAIKVKEMYQMITQDGDAELEPLDPSNPFESGVVFSVRPPKKSWKRIQNLSGGEKTLSSLALVFALHHFKPTPIYFLDEIDAALDHRNVATIALYIAQQAQNAQFIIISLRNHMFELADRLVGVHKTEGITKCIAIDPDSFQCSDAGNDGVPAV